MKFKVHFIVQIIVFFLFYVFFDLASAVVITFFHFIPSLDFFLKKIRFHPELHRKLTHNIFILAIAAAISYRYFDPLIVLLGISNFILHILMDSEGDGVEIFYPLSNYRFKLR